MKRILLIAAIAALACVPGRADQPPSADSDARNTRAHLLEILHQYPPSLTLVLQLDASLMSKEDYLAPYPALAAYLQQHPEIGHNPTFFLGSASNSRLAAAASEAPRAQAIREMKDALFFVMFFLGFTAAVTGIVYLARALIDHRKWLMAVKIQTDAHTKIVDRLSSNEDLMAYLQSTTGQRLLTLVPAIAAADAQAGSAPIGRILWSLQTGIVLATGGGDVGAVS